jgi:hypothetical protein
MEILFISLSPTASSQIKASIESNRIVPLDGYGLLLMDQSERFGLSQ